MCLDSHNVTGEMAGNLNCFEYCLLQKYATAAGIEIFSPVSHTLFNPADIIEKVSMLCEKNNGFPTI